MLGTALKESTGLFDRRFLINALLPSLVLIGLSGLVVLGSGTGLQTALATWNRQDALVKTLYTVAFMVLTVMTAAWVSGVTALLLRWFEGDWRRRPGRWLAAVGRRCHARRFQRLRPLDPDDYRRLYFSYPSAAEEVMPTRLGNVLKNCELHAQDRYGIDAALVWPRLYPLLPADHRAGLAAARSDLEFFLSVSALAAVFSAAAGVFLTTSGAPAGLFLLCHAGGAAVALLSYLCALGPARIYGEQVKVAFDVYRTELLKHLNREAAGEEEELVMWEALAQQWYRGVPVSATVAAASVGITPGATVAAAAEDGGSPRPNVPHRRIRLWVPSLPLSAWYSILVLLTSSTGALTLG